MTWTESPIKSFVSVWQCLRVLKVFKYIFLTLYNRGHYHLGIFFLGFTNMGFEEELIVLPPRMGSAVLSIVCECNICWGILEDPLMDPVCGEIFCRNCIERALREDPIALQGEHLPRCPWCRRSMNFGMRELAPGLRFVTQILNQLRARCRFTPAGCQSDPMRLSLVRQHEMNCQYGLTRDRYGNNWKPFNYEYDFSMGSTTSTTSPGGMCGPD